MARGYRFGVVGNLSTVPDGSTVLPTDDIQIWLKCASIKDKAYTTLSQVLADSTTLQALISSNNAVDYMVRSTTWASGVTADSGAMTLIGANNYASNTLLDDSTWLNAICNSTYFESVLNVKVPVMTSNTTPSGECSAIGYTQQNMAYKAFDGSSSSGWISNTKGNSWIQYQFTSVVKFCMVTKKDIYNRFNTFKMQTSTDGNTWVDVTDALTNSTDITAIVSTVTSGQYVRLQVLSNTTSYNDGIYGTTQGLQFYCRVDV
jgi:hypothetical protein